MENVILKIIEEVDSRLIKNSDTKITLCLKFLMPYTKQCSSFKSCNKCLCHKTLSSEELFKSIQKAVIKCSFNKETKDKLFKKLRNLLSYSIYSCCDDEEDNFLPNEEMNSFFEKLLEEKYEEGGIV